MLRQVVSIGLLAILVAATPASAITAQQRMETCKFGADDQKLAGAARKTFISKCMASDDALTKRAKRQPKK